MLKSPAAHCQFETHCNFKTVESFMTEHCCPLTRQKQAWMTFFSWFHVWCIQPSHKQDMFSASCCCRLQVHSFLPWRVCTRTSPPDNLQTASLFISVPHPRHGAATCWHDVAGKEWSDWLCCTSRSSGSGLLATTQFEGHRLVWGVCASDLRYSKKR